MCINVNLQATQHTCRSEQNFQEPSPSYHDGFQGSSSNQQAFMSSVPTQATPSLRTCFYYMCAGLCVYTCMCVYMYACREE